MGIFACFKYTLTREEKQEIYRLAGKKAGRGGGVQGCKTGNSSTQDKHGNNASSKNESFQNGIALIFCR